MTVELRTSSVDETRCFGETLAGLLSPGAVVVLIGDLGAGKTACAQGIARGLGVEDRVTSPTFTMMATHRADGRRGISSFLHADLYRVGSGVEADDLAIAELVEDGGVAAVEWGDIAPDVLGRHRVMVSFRFGDGDDERLITVDADEAMIDQAELDSALAPWRAS